MDKKIRLIIGFLVLIFGTSFVSAETYNGTDAYGWSELYNNGSVIQASYTLYTHYLGAFFFTIIYMVFQFMLMLKTRSPLLGLFTTGLVVGVSATYSLMSHTIIWMLSFYCVILFIWLLTKLIIPESD